VREAVWNLSRQSAGLTVRFVTNSPEIHARWTLTSDRLDMPHMPATGVSGLDLYARDDDGRWRWVANQPPTALQTTARLAGGLGDRTREYLLYLPLYNGVASLEIGVAPGRTLEPAPPSAVKPILVYGTSITQGACASRPGMVHTAILARRLERPVINLGFSGNGRLDHELAPLLAEVDAAVYLLDCLPNLSATEVAERVEPFVRALRQQRPDTPIILAEDRSYANAWIDASARQRNLDSRKALKTAYKALLDSGVKNLHYLDGDPQLGADSEATVDSSHPTDLGFLRMADAFEPTLRHAFGEQP
jgi:lysophospholipase L1-like esterase